MFFRYDIGGFYEERPTEGKYVEISLERYHELMDGQCLGKEIRWTENGDLYLHEYTITEEMVASSVKFKRDKLLAESDWIALKDVKLSKEKYAAWAEYRQKLRDITKQEGYPTNVIFPDKPE